MTDKAKNSIPTPNLRVASLDTQKPTAFELHPTAAQRKTISSQLELIGLRKLRFNGVISPTGDADWTLTGELGATVVQSCVLTLEPVSTRIDTSVSRQFLSEWNIQPDTDEEVEMLPDDDSEPLGSHIDLAAVMVEALSLALPLYPKSEGANLEKTTFTEGGIAPMSDDDARPFAGLSALRDKLKKDE